MLLCPAQVPDISKLTADTSTQGTQWGTGGMATKLTAGRIATAAGCTMVGMSGALLSQLCSSILFWLASAIQLASCVPIPLRAHRWLHLSALMVSWLSCPQVICSSCHPENVVRVMQGEQHIGTKFHPLQVGHWVARTLLALLHAC